MSLSYGLSAERGRLGPSGLWPGRSRTAPPARPRRFLGLKRYRQGRASARAVAGAALVCVALAGLGGGCAEPVTLAVGPAGDITIMTALSAESPEVGALRTGLEQEIIVIRPEPAFNVEVSGPDGFDIRRNWRNLVFLGSLDEESRISEMIADLLDDREMGELEAGERNLFLIRDKWAIGQLVAVLAAKDRDSLAGVVERNVGSLYNAFERVAVQNTKRILLKKDVQRNVARYLKREYGWALLVPDHFEVTEDAENRIVLFRTIEPARMILVHWVDDYGNELTPEGCLALRGRLAWNIYDEDTIAPDMTETEETNFLGRSAIKITGVWQNEKHMNGGPFGTYCFMEGDRLYLVDFLVYAPGMDKIPFLRELEAICHTFSTG